MTQQEGTILLRFLENSLHPWLNRTLSIDMDQVQAKVVANTPPFTLERAIIGTAVATLFWIVTFFVLHFMIVRPTLAAFRGTFDWIEPYYKLDWKEQAYYTSYWHSMIHALISGLLSLYCVAYADGKPGTTWFDTPEYQLTMYDTQKYAQMISIAYIAYDLLFCIVCPVDEYGMAATYAHHFCTFAGSCQV